MKRILLFTLVIGLFAGQASAGLYEMDKGTALLMRDISVSAGDTFTLKYIGSYPGGAAQKVAGSSSIYGDTMTYAVGFSGDLDDISGDFSAVVTFGLTAAQIAANLPNAQFTGFRLPVANDNNQGWSYRSYVIDATPTPYYSGWGPLATDTIGSFTTVVPLTNFSTLTGIGFEVKWTYSPGGSIGDTLHTSVVPVPAAVLLGILGLGVAGWKLRKYA